MGDKSNQESPKNPEEVYYSEWQSAVNKAINEDDPTLRPDVVPTEEYLNAEKTSLKDRLTGLGNRHAYEEDERYNFQILHEKGGLFVIGDYDKLKKVNDTLGHPAGDEFLIKGVRFLLANISAGDPIYRLGGDEVAFFLPGIPEHNADARMNELVQKANDHSSVDPTAPRFSFGYVYVSEGSQPDPKIVHTQADIAMYHAKFLGNTLMDEKTHVTRWEAGMRMPAKLPHKR